MNDILIDLYHAFNPSAMTEQEREVLEKNQAEIERIESQLTPADRVLYASVYGELADCYSEAAFSLGFRLAFQLMSASGFLNLSLSSPES